jgi:hypothetical protein
MGNREIKAGHELDAAAGHDRELSVNRRATVNQGAKIPLNDTHDLALSMNNHINLTEKR